MSTLRWVCHGAWRIVWLVFLLVIIWLILRSLEPVILFFALVFLLAMVLNPIVVWLHKFRILRFASVILLVLALIAIVGTIVLFAIPPLARQTQELMHSAPESGKTFAPASNRLPKIIPQFAKRCRAVTKSPVKPARPPEQ